jgi:hypothetical protein
MSKEIKRKLRCAVYTRKSSEEGLEQEFNSLHAQREACEAYIASQRSEGWALIRERRNRKQRLEASCGRFILQYQISGDRALAQAPEIPTPFRVKFMFNINKL